MKWKKSCREKVDNRVERTIESIRSFYTYVVGIENTNQVLAKTIDFTKVEKFITANDQQRSPLLYSHQVAAKDANYVSEAMTILDRLSFVNGHGISELSETDLLELSSKYDQAYASLEVLENFLKSLAKKLARPDYK